jgi:hypothetical protein
MLHYHICRPVTVHGGTSLVERCCEAIAEIATV